MRLRGRPPVRRTRTHPHLLCGCSRTDTGEADLAGWYAGCPIRGWVPSPRSARCEAKPAAGGFSKDTDLVSRCEQRPLGTCFWNMQQVILSLVSACSGHTCLGSPGAPGPQSAGTGPARRSCPAAPTRPVRPVVPHAMLYCKHSGGQAGPGRAAVLSSPLRGIQPPPHSPCTCAAPQGAPHNPPAWLTGAPGLSCLRHWLCSVPSTMNGRLETYQVHSEVRRRCAEPLLQLYGWCIELF